MVLPSPARPARLLLLLALTLPSPMAVCAQEQYRGLPLAPYEIYQAVVGYAADQNFEALKKSLKHFPGLIQALSEHCGKDLQASLEQALMARDAGATQAALMQMIFADFSLNLSQAERIDDRAARRDRLEMAYVDFTFLARLASAKDPHVADETRSGLSQLAKLDDLSQVAAQAAAIRSRLAAAVPHCGP